MPSMFHGIVDGVAVVTLGKGTPDKADWDAWIETLRVEGPGLAAIIIYAENGGPDSSQRARLAAEVAAMTQVQTTHVFSSSALVRGISTAIGWFIPQERRAMMHPVDQARQVLLDIGLPAAARSAVEARIEDDLSELGCPPAKWAP